MNQPDMKGSPARAASNGQYDDAIDLLAFFARLSQQKLWILGCTALFGGAALLYCLLARPVFTATASILPPQQQSSNASALLGQLGGLAGAAGNLAGLKSPAALYIGMLQSRTVADQLIAKFQLRQRYDQETLDATRKVLEHQSEMVNGKDGLISVSVDDYDPVFAATLANAYVDALKTMNQKLAVTDAAKRRLFFEQQLKDSKDQLAAAEAALRQTQESTGIVQPEGQLPAIVASVTQLRASIAAKEVQLEAMKSYATSQNPAYIKTQQELAGLREQLAKMETGQRAQGDLLVPTGKFAQSGLEYMRKLREMKYQETIFELLSKQYELAKIDEAKDSSLIQVLDTAIPPELKSKPKRMLILGGALLIGLAFGVLSGLLRANLREAEAQFRLPREELTPALKSEN
ncbi:Wzz/FepE/Etk N-terminal domain-containing protein [Chromobacterium sp. IIBBL 290-4]|uniref:GumC family protein n=1 Tax=Chromobacterium sp. IIBBL 290-4 TaxID=2953890 RepID=UPI0020B7E72A|nr:Wzz/FepE/Etk N-terminal domain-containing protein [Chromobacterium sp. IIBBL 290-4]UTH75325.1 Wzz/FepE/Etk N-terminal domain-containing protein [Chromobacterium sp. IIBBL 290-4]